jgi:hypothetical protein
MPAIELSRIKLGRQALHFPTVVNYNRLEGRPRAADFSRALRAEVRDPLWLISKQWQMGEFQGEDAATPILAKLLLNHQRMDSFSGGPAGPDLPLPEERPLETVVERQLLSMQRAGRPVHLDLRLMAGRYWKKLLGKEGLSAYLPEYLRLYAISDPDPADATDHFRTAHPRVWQRFRSAAGRSLDGYALLDHLNGGGAVEAGFAASTPAADVTVLNLLADQLKSWWVKLLQQDETEVNPSWQPERLEYQFQTASAKGTTNENTFVATQYYQGNLDWYNLDGDMVSDKLQEEKVVDFFPSTLAFPGMPARRWWTMEDDDRSLINVEPDTTDINKLLVLDFQLQYANDWFLLPLTVPVGTISRVSGLLVTDSFGETTWVQATGSGEDEDWQRWTMFHPSVVGNADEAASEDLLILPTIPKLLEGKPLEEVRMIRDEMANMVWALESTITLADGQPRRGKEAARELRSRYVNFLGGPIEEVAHKAARYRVVNSVPECWIPFLPVRAEVSDREIKLQRAAMPRIISGDSNPPQKVEPRSGLIRHGLDESPAQTYSIFENEVQRAGIQVRQSFQRTRWYNGKVYTWLGIRKTTGRGEGNSGLAFDYLETKG